ncbi:alanine--tRNA ligase [Ochrobactrum sp. MYb15]|uniref:alanine--tRNA ligase n=1 Tax=Brucella TaxID=234 RepID=UPI000464A3F0|nr:alanine--tRNA ligase [Brucella rhizosphaerae]PQZ51722.1 alanine--tRNA ligase [Ochrobactrum sp. MYb19]PRA65244.1 alanine--tRNA ligase [Ochrobactrum sp. MYb18]PRA76934.1 alanine--tRNA ligase [Brucella thiophenivorans]PRA93432.1 alanine--tRNA ligase [Ochrobactrum sp. MYb14]PRA98942.1 alanine--tRNA ligase [Ochrobactrum sp. MYb15]
MAGVNEIRSTFLDYFRKNGHEVVSSSPLVPRNDPTLMFTNAGMVQFKNVFTGLEQRPYSRATTSQKCVRAGGKHNDLDNVGYTARHHTFFEMLGNFSFGDYFKEEAISHAWNLITKEFGLNKDKLLVTVYHTDDAAANFWKKIAGLSDDRIIRIATSDNFWAMGDTGPCGPCSEIFYDHGDHIWGGPPGSADEDGDRFIEIWNLVFMQFEQLSPEQRIDLPRPSIDTGMGLERVAAVLQGVHDNYDIDLFKALIRASEDATGVKAEGDFRASHRVIADHLRASSFLIADGVLPSNEGRGYVLRRIMRRAMRHAQLLGAKEPLMWRLLPALIREMGQAYPELIRAEALISETLKLEETRFRKTLERGLGLLSDASESLVEGDRLDGETAFKLYDTYGFPLDLTQDALRQRGVTVDTDGFNLAMERQKAEARANWTGSGEAATETIWFGIKDKVGATEFLGYETESAEGVITALVRDGAEVASAAEGENVSVIVNQTPFYGESGGQQGDTGTISGEGFAITIKDTQKKGEGVFVHTGQVTKGSAKVGDAVELKVDAVRRTRIRSNHSATHLLHEALRETLGSHVAQKGSLVAPDRLRFDFSHPKPISAEELTAVENLANEIILQNAPVSTRLMAVDDAIAEGAMALFGEKYGDEVRVVSMGTATHGEKAGKAYSVELCGGTHVRQTGDIGLVRILSDSGVAAGVRRMEALTGEAARLYLEEQDERVKAIAGVLKTTPSEALERVNALVDERKKLERELTEARRQLALSGGASDGGSAVETVNGVNFLGKVVTGVSPRDLKPLADEGKKQVGSGVVLFIGVGEDGKASAVAAVTDDLVGRFSAVDLVRAASGALGGAGGGGRPDMAQAGGPDGTKASEAIAAVKALIV